MSEINGNTKYYSAVRAAKEVGVAQQTIINHIKKGKLKAAVTAMKDDGSPKEYRISEDDLLDWVESEALGKRSGKAESYTGKKYSEMGVREMADRVGGWMVDEIHKAYQAGFEAGKEAMRNQIMGAIKEEK